MKDFFCQADCVIFAVITVDLKKKLSLWYNQGHDFAKIKYKQQKKGKKKYVLYSVNNVGIYCYKRIYIVTKWAMVLLFA